MRNLIGRLSFCAGLTALSIVFLNLILLDIATAQTTSILNVSYDPTRELYDQINSAFVAEWEKTNSKKLDIRQSHGGSGKQARSVIDGLEADVVTLALSYDIDMLASVGKLLPADWQKRLPNNSCPYTSSIVFLVRQGNPKHIKDWDDLIKPGVEVITPNPKTSGGARWNYLAAWGFAAQKFNNDQTKIKQFMKALFKNVPVLDSGARGSTTTFVQRGIGDVLLSWENEAYLAAEQLGSGKLEIVAPSLSILAEPPVAMVDSVVDKHQTRDVVSAYLKFLYSEPAQEIIAKNHYRPQLKAVVDKYRSQISEMKLLTVDGDFGGWQNAQKVHFQDAGTFDEIYAQ